MLRSRSHQTHINTHINKIKWMKIVEERKGRRIRTLPLTSYGGI